MNMLDIRNLIDDALRKAGFEFKGGGCELVPPYSADLEMTLDGTDYIIEVTRREWKLDPASAPQPKEFDLADLPAEIPENLS